jgi:amino acid transporter
MCATVIQYNAVLSLLLLLWLSHVALLLLHMCGLLGLITQSAAPAHPLHGEAKLTHPLLLRTPGRTAIALLLCMTACGHFTSVHTQFCTQLVPWCCTQQMMATAPEESVNPTRDVPLAIGISVAGCTILYLLMALVISGMHDMEQHAGSICQVTCTDL